MSSAPNFMIIGAAKSGTTSMATYLGQHPDVFVSATKEPNYFALQGKAFPDQGPAPAAVIRQAIYNWSVADWQSYAALFDGVRDETAIGEASVRYLYFDKAAENIHAALPDTRLVAILRNPVGRLYSHYNMNRQILLEPLELEAALEAEPDRIASGWGWDWHYAALGQYAQQLARYDQLFSSDQIKVFLYDDLRKDPLQVYAEICRHIGVRDDFVPEMGARGMVSSRPKSTQLARFLWWPNRWRYRLQRYGGPVGTALVERLKGLNAAPIPKLDDRLRQAIAPRFREDIAALQDRLGRHIDW